MAELLAAKTAYDKARDVADERRVRFYRQLLDAVEKGAGQTEIADALGVSQPTVNELLGRARRTLAEEH